MGTALCSCCSSYLLLILRSSIIMSKFALIWFNQCVVMLCCSRTRAVQKLIETIKTPQEIALVISALKPGFLDLIKDLNGNHVVQRCLQCLSPKDNEVYILLFLLDLLMKFWWLKCIICYLVHAQTVYVLAFTHGKICNVY